MLSFSLLSCRPWSCGAITFENIQNHVNDASSCSGWIFCHEQITNYTYLAINFQILHILSFVKINGTICWMTNDHWVALPTYNLHIVETSTWMKLALMFLMMLETNTTNLRFYSSVIKSWVELLLWEVGLSSWWLV